MAVFVLDRHKHPLMPCSEKRARVLLARHRAVIHRMYPFTIRLKDRQLETSVVQPVVLKLDPGSRTTGIALAREEVTHNRRRPTGWLPPSLRSRIGNVLAWVRRYRRWVPIQRLEVEWVKFDLALIQQPELTGIAYQRGELFGWEVRAYLLEKFQRRCVYCGGGNTPFEIDHVVPKSRGGSDRVSNLVLSCHTCNAAKGNQTTSEFGHPAVEAQAKMPLKDAAAVNATRHALVEALGVFGLPIGTWSGGRTRWNRERFGIEKGHALDALCVGEVADVHAPSLRACLITAQGRGSHQRTNVDASGFPRGYLTRKKRIRGFSTGDLVRAEVPGPLKTAGVHVGRVAVRASGSFRVGRVDGINVRHCRLVQRGDGYGYQLG